MPQAQSDHNPDINPEQQQERTVKRLAAGFQRFKKRWYCAENNLYANLAEGQNPLALVIACSDSRVDPVLLTDSCPGDLFVIRNVANIVPPYAPDGNYHGVSAALEFAVRYLKVSDIIVMGHAECGGIQSLLDEAQPQHNEFLSIGCRSFIAPVILLTIVCQTPRQKSAAGHVKSGEFAFLWRIC